MIWVILLAAAFVVPFWRLLPEYGLNKWWAITAIFPVAALILLYLMAFGPGYDGGRDR